MSDAPADAPKNSAKPSTKISYCPHLDLYHFCHVDGTEYFFDTPQLEKSIESYQRAGDHRQAEFMAMLTSFGRNFPHKIVAFDADGTAALTDLPARATPVVDAEVVPPAKTK
jgi:hypothetical protein